MKNELMNMQQSMNINEVEKTAALMVQSNMFDDVKSLSQAAVKIIAGKEIGITPFAAMTGLNIIKGRIAMSANLIASAIKASSKYDYRVITHTDDICEIEFFENGKKLGDNVVFSIADARKAGIANREIWQKYPKNMLFARAISNGARWQCPDVFNGNVVYDPDELNFNDNNDNSVNGDNNMRIVNDDSDNFENESIAKKTKEELAADVVAIKKMSDGLCKILAYDKLMPKLCEYDVNQELALKRLEQLKKEVVESGNSGNDNDNNNENNE